MEQLAKTGSFPSRSEAPEMLTSTSVNSKVVKEATSPWIRTSLNFWDKKLCTKCNLNCGMCTNRAGRTSTGRIIWKPRLPYRQIVAPLLFTSIFRIAGLSSTLWKVLLVSDSTHKLSVKATKKRNVGFKCAPSASRTKQLSKTWKTSWTSRISCSLGILGTIWQSKMISTSQTTSRPKFKSIYQCLEKSTTAPSE